MKLIKDIIWDLLVFLLPKVPTDDKRFLIFLVHPRDRDDIYKKMPFLKKMPDFVLSLFERYMWPVTVSKINHKKTGEIYGFMISIPSTAKTMMYNRSLAKKKIKQALKLGYKKGGRIAALGALTASLTYGGKDVYDGTINITTGHAYTVINIKNIFKESLRVLNANPEQVKVAIVGAAGSIGSGSAKLFCKDGVKDFLLVDLERKKEQLERLASELSEKHRDLDIKISSNLSDLRDRDVIVAATNHPDALIKKEHLSQRAVVIIDDAQPSDLDPAIFDMDNVLALEGGASKTKNITANFPFGLCHKDDNYSCMAEGILLLLNSSEDKAHLGPLTDEHIDFISKLSDKYGFRPAEFQNYKESCIANKKIKKVLSFSRFQ